MIRIRGSGLIPDLSITGIDEESDPETVPGAQVEDEPITYEHWVAYSAVMDDLRVQMALRLRYSVTLLGLPIVSVDSSVSEDEFFLYKEYLLESEVDPEKPDSIALKRLTRRLLAGFSEMNVFLFDMERGHSYAEEEGNSSSTACTEVSGAETRSVAFIRNAQRKKYKKKVAVMKVQLGN